MINIEQCQQKAKELALYSKQILGNEKLEVFNENLEKIIIGWRSGSSKK